jgi:hypothetical protein
VNAADALMVAAVVVPLAEVVKYSKRVPETWGVPVVMVLSALGCALWAVSTPGTLVLTNAWNLFAGWATVVVSAAGVYGFIREARQGVMDAERKP